MLGDPALRNINFLKAINEATREEMLRDPTIFLMGQDISDNVYGSSAGLFAEFGGERVRDTPISEAAMVGAAAGAAMVGMRPIVDLYIASFVYVAMDQLISIVAKSTYLYGGQAKLPMVVRACMMYGVSNAAQHSDRPYSMFMNVPGLKIVVPSSPYDVKGLLKTAIRDDDPVLFFEDSTLWGIRGHVPEEDYVIPFGKADIKRPGTDVTVVAISGMVTHALAAAELLAGENISVEVIDPRTLVPLDKETILTSVAKTGRLVVVDAAHKSCSASSEIAALVSEEAFWDLKAPIARVVTPNVHIPFSPALEPQLFPDKEKIASAIRQTFSM